MVKLMKKNHSNFVLLLLVLTILTGCFGNCGDWNCLTENPRWRKAVDDCFNRNFDEVIKRQLGYQSRIEVQDSEIGQHISHQCNRNGGRYNVKKDKKYGHLFAK